MGRASLNATLENVVIKVVPMENLKVGSLSKQEIFVKEEMVSLAGRGVDLNRNWSVEWGKKEKVYHISLFFMQILFDIVLTAVSCLSCISVHMMSEPETQIMRKLAISFDPHIWINVHSGMEALFMPYDHKNRTPDGLPSQQVRLLLEELNNVHCHKRCMIGSGGGSVGYLAHGTATDYMYDVVRVPMSFTFEIYGDSTASTKDCFKMFNPVYHTTFKRVLNVWAAAFFTIFKPGQHQIDVQSKAAVPKVDKWVSIDDYFDGYLMGRRNRYGKKMEVPDVGMQEIRTYFRLFMLSSVLLFFMFCSRIS
ncbi:putative HXXXD-type acyl-transferase family protein [Hibiscus syriacus]|uniref:HXXXD-type acyl-transferase family protein n=1 Tax=Hibiscus syriacus TaxID=106335 RepID=A0A6A3CSH4_HIBSY|nr:putative HXXXD-type acyl-transferase family protein [Hibiscus syriacus]